MAAAKARPTPAEIEAYISKHDIKNKIEIALNEVLATTPDAPIRALIAALQPIAEPEAPGATPEADGDAIRKLFAKVDKDGSGGIDMAEFTAVVKAAGLEEAEIKKLFASADKDGNGTLDVDEFKQLVASSPALSIMALGADAPLAADGEDALKKLFAKVDKDGSGGIDVAEFTAAVKAAGMTDAEVKTLFDSADKDGNGTLDMDEFKKLVSASPILSKELGTHPAAPAAPAAAQPVAANAPPPAADGDALQKLFAKVDKDGSGGIDMVEFTAAVKAAGLEESEIKKLFASADTDGNGGAHALYTPCARPRPPRTSTPVGNSNLTRRTIADLSACALRLCPVLDAQEFKKLVSASPALSKAFGVSDAAEVS